jgi:hypothetical protein
MDLSDFGALVWCHRRSTERDVPMLGDSFFPHRPAGARDDGLFTERVRITKRRARAREMFLNAGVRGGDVLFVLQVHRTTEIVLKCARYGMHLTKMISIFGLKKINSIKILLLCGHFLQHSARQRSPHSLTITRITQCGRFVKRAGGSLVAAEKTRTKK